MARRESVVHRTIGHNRGRDVANAPKGGATRTAKPKVEKKDTPAYRVPNAEVSSLPYVLGLK